ncbi:MAG TPA: hypothetical protein VGS19_27185 [Streptosporangiaceae bacterium]|nr:hypothetical protein [Streptosporangiaceae bacterium]
MMASPDGGLWARHDQYRNGVRKAVLDACASIGFRSECRVLLLGFASNGEAGDARLEPTGGPYDTETFATLPQRVFELFDQDARHNALHAVVAANESRRRDLLDRLRCQAVVEALQQSPASGGWTFFASRSARITDVDTHIAVGVETGPLADVPSLPAAQPSGDYVIPSLVHALIDEILDRLWNALRAPLDGDRIMPLRAPTFEVVRAAAGRFVRAALRNVGGWRGLQADALLNTISALPYEGRPGVGNLLLAPVETPAVEVELQLSTPIGLRERRTVRKLMEANSAEVALLVDDEAKVYGIGRYSADRQPSGLLVSFVGRGAWDLIHADRALMSVRDGEARLPAAALDVARLTDLIDRLLPDADADRLVELARAAERHHHGAMLIISSDAASEAARLSPQSIPVRPTQLSTGLLTQLTSMDGAILLDAQGRCHALGVILDGLAAGHGDPARGSRYNNPVRYLDSDPPKAIVIVYSSDGGVDLLPSLRSRQDRDRVTNVVERYLRLVDTRPLPLAQVFDAWDDVNALAFYLSDQQCRDVNAATSRLRSWCAAHDRPLIGMQDFEPDLEMDDTYWLW